MKQKGSSDVKASLWNHLDKKGYSMASLWSTFIFKSAIFWHLKIPRNSMQYYFDLRSWKTNTNCCPRRKQMFYRRVWQMWFCHHLVFVCTSPPERTHRSLCEPRRSPRQHSTLHEQRHINSSEMTQGCSVIDRCAAELTGDVVMKSSRGFGQLIFSTDGLTGAMSAE